MAQAFLKLLEVMSVLHPLDQVYPRYPSGLFRWPRPHVLFLYGALLHVPPHVQYVLFLLNVREYPLQP